MLASPFLFSSAFCHTLCYLSTAILYISSSPFLRIHFSLFSVCLMLFFSNARSLFPSLLFSFSLVLILHGSSPVIHPGQATIPYKASGSPHLASYFHIRSAVTDRVYTGSSLECEAASLSAVPQTFTMLSAPGHKPHTSSLLTPCAPLPALSCLTSISQYFSPFLLNLSSHLVPLSFVFSLYFLPPSLTCRFPLFPTT